MEVILFNMETTNELLEKFSLVDIMNDLGDK